MRSCSRHGVGEIRLGVLVAAVLLFTYAPLARAQYGFGDDFVLLVSERPLEGAYLKDGRPVFALAQMLVHQPIERLSQFGILRLLSGIGVAGIAVIFFRQTRRLGGTRIEHACLAIGIGTLPCLHAYVAQANFWLAPFAGLCVLLAVTTTFNATRYVKKPIHLLRPQVLLRILPALLLMLVAAGAYQPMLSWYWTVVVIQLLDRRFLTSTSYRRRVYTTIAIGFVFFITAFVAFKFYFLLFETKPKERTALTHRPFEKLYWFLRIQLPLALNFWHLMDSSKRLLTLGIATIPLAMMIAGFVTSCQGFRKTILQNGTENVRSPRNLFLGRAALIVFVILLTHVHWLVIGISPQSYRIIAPLGVATLLVTYWAVMQLSELITQPSTRNAFRRVLLVSVAVLALLTCQSQAQKYWIEPHTTAYRYMLMTIREGMHDEIDRVHLVRQAADEGFVAEWFIESFGRPASEREWTIEDMVKSALRDTETYPQIDEITHGMGTDPIPNDDHTLVIDMRKLVQFRL